MWHDMATDASDGLSDMYAADDSRRVATARQRDAADAERREDSSSSLSSQSRQEGLADANGSARQR